MLHPWSGKVHVVLLYYCDTPEFPVHSESINAQKSFSYI